MKQNQTQSRERFPMWRYLFVMLLALLMGTGGAWATTVDVTTIYSTALSPTGTTVAAGDILLLQNYNGGSANVYAYDDGSAAKTTTGDANLARYFAATSSAPAVFNTDYTKYLWEVVTADGGFYLKNVSTSRYLSSQTSQNTAVPTVDATSSAAVYTFDAATGDGVSTHPYAISSTSNTGTSGTTNMTSLHIGGQGVIVWGAAGANSHWNIVKTTRATASVNQYTITYHMNGIESSVYEKTFDVAEGDVYPEITGLPYGVTATKPSGTVSATETKTIDWTFSKFTYAASYDAITQWYAMDVHGTEARYPVYYNGSNAPAVNYTANTDVPQGVYGFGHVPYDTYKWAFVGNPFSGFKIYNKSAGSSVSMYQSSDADTQITMDASGQAFTVYQGTSSDYIAFKIADRSYYMNHRSLIIKGWTDADAGSSFRVYAVNYDPAEISGDYYVKIGPSSSYINTSATAALEDDATACAMHTSSTKECVNFTYNADKGAYTITDQYGNNIVYTATGNGGDNVTVVSSSDATDSNKWWFITSNIGGTTGYDACPFTAQVSTSSSAWNLAGNYNSEGANTKLGMWTTNGNNTYFTIEEAGYTVSGTVTSDGTTPISGAKVTLSNDSKTYTATTGSDGTYTVGGVPNGTYTATVKANFYAAGTKSVTVADAASTGNNVALTANGRIEGDGSTGTFDVADVCTAWTSIPAATPWKLNMEVESTADNAYNDWGSTILGTGTDVTSSTFANGFQLWQSKDATKINFKSGKDADDNLTYGNVSAVSSYTIQLSYNGSDTYTITTTIDGVTNTETKTAQTTLNAFSKFCYALPTGINIKSLSIIPINTVSVTGLPETLKATATATINSTTYKDGDFIEGDIAAKDVTASTVAGYSSTVTVSDSKIINLAYTFAPTEGTPYIIKVSGKELYFDVTTLGINEPNAGTTTNNASLNSRYMPVYFAQNGTGWTIKSASDATKYLAIGSRAWNAVIDGTTAYAWTITSADDGTFTISKSSGNYIGMDTPTAGAPLYNNMASDKAINFELYSYVDYSVAITGAPTGTTAEATCYGLSATDGGTIKTTPFLTAEDISATDISGYTYAITLSGTSISVAYTAAEIANNPTAVTDLLNRIGGDGTADKFVTQVDPSLNSKHDQFIITSSDSKPCIKGTSISAVTAGIGYYLNHTLNINISWNKLNECGDGAYVTLPATLTVPTGNDVHNCDADYRYYLNYCTFGYSMTTWTWKRWQKEVDWMALHGVNMPLQIIGMEKVWKNFLMNDLTDCGASANYTEEEAEGFVSGPAFTAWWGMNNLQGWGGDGSDPAKGVHDDAWYARQQTLATNILTRERELGMQPVLPGFSGMVPNDFQTKTGISALSQGSWSGFTRPYILDPTSDKFATIAAKYYARLKEVMGESQYYSMDPFHEGSGTCPVSDPEGAYRAVYNAMNTAKAGSQFVIQQWQWYSFQEKSLSGVPVGKLIVLDLFSDGKPAFDSWGIGSKGYYPQHAIYCAIPNYGGRSGLMGRLQNLTDNYFSYRNKYYTIKGIGAAPESIEQTPVTYDLLFELPWCNGTKPDVAAWVSNYATARYGTENTNAQTAWSLLKQSALNYGADAIQGPVEDVWAAAPNLDCSPASGWGKTLSNVTSIYTPAKQQMVIKATDLLLGESDKLSGSNYNYDLVEIGSAAMADYAYYLLKGISAANTANNSTLLAKREAAFLQLILDVDAFKGTNTNFRLGKWTQEARSAAAELTDATTATPDWYELANARTLITTWGDNNNLIDYSYRSWQGLMSDLYYPRWKAYFDGNCTHDTSRSSWFYYEWNWAHRNTYSVTDATKSTTALAEGATGYSYSAAADVTNGTTVEQGKDLMDDYMLSTTLDDDSKYYCYRHLDNDLSSTKTITENQSRTWNFKSAFNKISDSETSVDLTDATLVLTPTSGDATTITDFSTAVPTTLTAGDYTAVLTLSDLTTVTFKMTVAENTSYTVTFTNTSNLGYVATFSAAENVSTSGTNVTAYTATVSDNTVTLNAISDGIIAANAGVILVNTDATTPTTATLTGTSTAATATQTYGESNRLQGVPAEKTLTADEAANSYVLVAAGLSSNYAVFRELDATSETSRTFAAHKAYLQLPAQTGARVYNIVFGEATGIKEIQNSSNGSNVQGNIYDLTGRKQNKLQHGVNIVNGKKVIR